jgi:phosphoglycolate phosphatase
VRRPSLFLDLDGPILDVSERYFRVHQYILKELGSRRLVRSKSSYWNMKRDRQPLSAILEKLSQPRVDQAAFSRLWLANIESPEYLILDQVIPGATKQLLELGRLFTLVLVTLRHNRNGVHEQLRNLGLQPLLTKVLCQAPAQDRSWEVKRDLIAESGLISNAAWIVGDTEVDIRAGKALGMGTVAVLSGIRNLKNLKAVSPDLIVKDIRHLGMRLPNRNRIGNIR